MKLKNVLEIDEKKLTELLVWRDIVAKDDFDLAVESAKTSKRTIPEVLVDGNLIKDDQLGQLIAQDIGVGFANLRNERVDDEVFRMVPELVARNKGVIAFARDENGVKLAMTDPTDLDILHLLEKRFGEPVSAHYVTPRDFANILSRYRSSLKDEFDKILARLEDPLLSREERDRIVIRIVDMILQYAYQNKTSDVHIEPYTRKIVVRFRIDGVMHDVLEMPRGFHELVLTRIKILAKMRTDEHRAAQDGKLRLDFQGEVVDVRVSVVPVVEGENVVMRILSSNNRQYSLTDLGFSIGDLSKVQRAVANPHGMILVTGPTGSGKTTTIYAVMKILNRREVHISTIEDPVEYDIEGISQIQVNVKTNLTFAQGLRAIVRQDPDIIMVGEVRDEETASIAVNSAMTGHLVLSTLHTNDAATTFPRLLDMGIEPFLVASTVNLVIAQRLVRKICERCRVSYLFSEEDIHVIESIPQLKQIFKEKGYKDLKKVRLYRGGGCSVCGNTGFTGRVGIFEVMEVNEEIQRLIIKQATSDDIMLVAQKSGMKTMMEDGMQRVFRGTTTFHEVLRVTRE